MRMDRRALNRNTLPFIDLHQERRLSQRRRATLNTKRLFGLALLLTLQVSGLIPLTMQALAFRPKIARAAQILATTDKRLQAETQANAKLEPDIKRWERYQKSRDSRRQVTRAFLSAAQDLPPDVYIERLQFDAADKQTHIQIQGIAQTQEALRNGLNALLARPEFTGLRLTETSDANIAGRHEIRFHAEITKEGK